MRSLAHISPRYVRDRVVVELYQRKHPTRPWLTQTANQMLETLLKPTDEMLEFGCGRSSVWFAQRVSRITSVEHVEAWAEKVRAMIAERGLANIEVVLATVPNVDAPRAFVP